MITSIVFGLVIPYFLISYVDPNGYIFDLDAILLNGVIFAAVYTFYGIFNKDLVIRFLIGIGWMATLIYFYTVGNNFSPSIYHIVPLDICVLTENIEE